MTEYQNKVLTHYTQDKEDGTKESTIKEVFDRVAPLGVRNTVVLGYGIEEQHTEFRRIFQQGLAIPGGRILANGGGTGNQMLGNCHVQGITDSRQGIMECQANTFEVYAHGGGVGTNFSPIRPKGAIVKGVKSFASGPCSFIDAFDHYADTIKQGSSGRRAAKMTILNVDHPDISEFVKAKTEHNRWNNTNVSVGIYDEFMEAVIQDKDWSLEFNGYIYATVKAKDLWDEICTCAWKGAEPGLIFLDTLNRNYPLRYLVELQAVNPCGELPLRPHEMCILLSLVLSKFVSRYNNEGTYFNWKLFEETVTFMVMYMDGLIDYTKFPLEAIKETMLGSRPIGLGITGLADALFLLELPYGNYPDTLKFLDKLGSTTYKVAKETSERLAVELGAFPEYDAELADFPPRRNSVLLAIAPTGSVSGLIGCSYGCEPHFATTITRDESLGKDIVTNAVIQEWMVNNEVDELPSWSRFIGGAIPEMTIRLEDHLEVLRVLAKHIDSGISKTVNLPSDATVEDVSDVFMYCWKNQIKGVTVYRNNCRKDQPVSWSDTSSDSSNLITELEEVDIELVDMYRVPRKRPSGGLPAMVYGLKFNPEQPTLWITITELDGEPFELFFSINNKTYQELLDFAGKSVTSSWRRAEWDIHLFEDFQNYESANGGSFYEYTKGKRVYIKSILHGISIVVLNHFKKMGLNNDDRVGVPTPMLEVSGSKITVETGYAEVVVENTGEKCPECNEYTLIRSEGCNVCTNCGFSKCG